MSTQVRWPEPPDSIEGQDLKDYLRELIRTLGAFDSEIFSQDTQVLFETARKRPFTEVSVGYSMGPEDCVILTDASASSVTITLPLALDAKNTFYDIKKTDTNAGTVVSVEGSGSELPVVLNGVNRPSVTLYSDGTNFWII